MENQDSVYKSVALSCQYLHSSKAYVDLPDLGIGYETISDAALFCAKWLVFEGYFDVDLPNKDAYSIFDRSINNYFDEKKKYLESCLIAAIERGYLKAEKIERNLDLVIKTEKSYVSMYGVRDWLEECGLSCKDYFEEYEDYVIKMHDVAAKAMYMEEVRRAIPQPKLLENESLLDALRLRTAENIKLMEELSQYKNNKEMEKLISPRQKNTYLNIIGAMLGILLGKAPNGKPYSTLQSQQAIIDVIHGTYGETGGLSKRTLEDKFALAKRSLESRS